MIRCAQCCSSSCCTSTLHTAHLVGGLRRDAHDLAHEVRLQLLVLLIQRLHLPVQLPVQHAVLLQVRTG